MFDIKAILSAYDPELNCDWGIGSKTIVWGRTMDLADYIEANPIIAAVRNMGDLRSAEEELGDLLFSVVNVSRLLGVNPEEALKGSTDKFIDRFGFIEERAIARGADIESMTLEEMNEIWEEAKLK